MTRGAARSWQFPRPPPLSIQPMLYPIMPTITWEHLADWYDAKQGDDGDLWHRP